MNTRLSRKRGYRDPVQIITEKENRKKIVTFFEQRGHGSRLEVSRELRMNRGTARRHINKLLEEGVLYEECGDLKYFPMMVSETYLDKKVIEAVSANDVQRGFLNSAPETGRVYVGASPSSKEASKVWSVTNPLIAAFLYDDPFWLKEIFSYALREKLIDEDYFSGKKSFANLSGHELRSIWDSIFGKIDVCAVTFALAPKSLLEFLETQDGKRALDNALSEKARSKLLKEAMKLWKVRKENA
jgi:hypothetical protein